MAGRERRLHGPIEYTGNTSVDVALLLAAHARVFGIGRLSGLLRTFREQSGATRQQLAAALAQEDLFEVQELAHKLAGGCEVFGLAAAPTACVQCRQRLPPTTLALAAR